MSTTGAIDVHVDPRSRLAASRGNNKHSCIPYFCIDKILDKNIGVFVETNFYRGCGRKILFLCFRKGDVPSAPGIPTVTRLRNSVYQLNWEPAQAHGSPVTLYVVEGSIVDDNYKQDNNADDKADVNEHWTLYHNGTDNYWIITGNMDHKYRFRVQAKNAYGYGDWSGPSAVVDLTESAGGILAAQQHLGLALGLSVVVITLMLLCLCYFICRKYIYHEAREIINPPDIYNFFFFYISFEENSSSFVQFVTIDKNIVTLFSSV